MSAAEKVAQLPLTPRDLALDLFNKACECDRDGTADEVALQQFVKAMEGKRAALRHAEHVEYFALVIDGKQPPKKAKPKAAAILTDRELEARKIEKAAAQAARRLRLADGVQRLVLMKFIMPNGLPLGQCTLDYVARVGGAFSKLGKRRDKRTIEQVYSERDLEKAKI